MDRAEILKVLESSEAQYAASVEARILQESSRNRQDLIGYQSEQSICTVRTEGNVTFADC